MLKVPDALWEEGLPFQFYDSPQSPWPELRKMIAQPSK